MTPVLRNQGLSSDAQPFLWEAKDLFPVKESINGKWKQIIETRNVKRISRKTEKWNLKMTPTLHCTSGEKESEGSDMLLFVLLASFLISLGFPSVSCSKRSFKDNDLIVSLPFFS